MQFDKVIVVDEEDLVLANAKKALTRAGIADVLTVNESQEAYRLISQNTYDAAFIALRLNGEITGTAILQKLLTMEESPQNPNRIPIVVLMSTISNNEIKLLQELDLAYVLKKPFNEEALFGKLKDAYEDLHGTNGDKAFAKSISDILARADGPLAMELITKRIEKYPQNFKLVVLHAQAFFSLDKVDEAQAVIDKLLAKNPSFLPAWNMAAKISMKKGEFEKACQFMEKSQELSPLNIKRLVLIGDLHLECGRSHIAEGKYKEALTMSPDSEIAKMGLARALIEQGKVEEGKELIGHLEDPDTLVSMLNLKGVMLVRAGKYREGLDLYKKAMNVLADNGKRYQLLFNMGIAYYRLKKTSDATRTLQQCLNCAPPEFKKVEKLLTKVRAGERPTDLNDANGNSLVSDALLAKIITPKHDREDLIEELESEGVPGKVSYVDTDSSFRYARDSRGRTVASTGTSKTVKR